MPTSIHIPAKLLVEVERRAKRLNVSRNRYIVQVLEKEVARETEWSPAFLASLRSLGRDGETFADTLDTIVARRSSKTSVKF